MIGCAIAITLLTGGAIALPGGVLLAAVSTFALLFLDTCGADPCYMGFVANDIVPVVNDAFLADNPAVDALLKEVSIPLLDIFAQNSAMNNGDDDVQAQAAKWIENNQDQVNTWLEAARSAAN